MPCATISRRASICVVVSCMAPITLAAVSASSPSLPGRPILVIELSHSSSSRKKRFCPWPQKSSRSPTTSDPARPSSDAPNAVPMPPSCASSPTIRFSNTSTAVCPSWGAKLRMVSTTAGTTVARP